MTKEECRDALLKISRIMRRVEISRTNKAGFYEPVTSPAKEITDPELKRVFSLMAKAPNK